MRSRSIRPGYRRATWRRERPIADDAALPELAFLSTHCAKVFW